MLGHHTAQNCQHQYGVRLRALMERFQNVVRIVAVGHVHTEMLHVFNSMTDVEKPVMVSSVGGSLTTYNHMNPSFTLIDFDQETMAPVNIHSYYIDVDEANASGEPDWKELTNYLVDY